MTSSSSKLTYVEPSNDPNVNILLYGPPKTGKTIGAASAPGPTLYLNADRPNATRMAHKMFPGDLREVKLEGLQTLIDVTLALEGKHDFATVVLDPIGAAYRTVLEDLSNRALSPAIQIYGDTGTHLERFCRHLFELPVNVVLVCHDQPIKDEASGEFVSLPWTGTNNPALGQKLMSEVDIIGYTGVVEGEGDAPPRYMAQLINANGRRGGDRFGALGAAADLNLSEWVDLAKKATANNKKEGSK